MQSHSTGRLSAVAAVTASLLLSACGGAPGDLEPSGSAEVTASNPVDVETTDSPAAANGSDLPDPCALLMQSEIAATTGVAAFGEGVFNDQLSNERQVICDWTSEDPFATAQVLVGDFGESFESQRQSIEDAFDEPTVPVELADAAYRTQEGSLVAMKVGSLFVQVSYIPSGPGEVADETIALAQFVLERL